MAAIPFDWSDVQTRLDALRAAYYHLISGNKEAKLLFRNDNNHQQEILYHPGNVAALQEEIRKAEAELAGGRRFAIRFGSRAGRIGL